MKIITLLMFFVTFFSIANENSDCQTLEETQELIYYILISDIDWLVDARKVAFDEKAWETIELLDRKLLGAIYGIFIAESESKIPSSQISKIENLMASTVYYPLTWDKLNSSHVKDKLNKIKKRR